jgi:hypothetical protein
MMSSLKFHTNKGKTYRFFEKKIVITKNVFPILKRAIISVVTIEILNVHVRAIL